MIDVTMTATCRPDLVEDTFRSFKEKLFSHLPVRTLFLNIDPIAGPSEAGDQVAKIARSQFLRVEIRRPETPSHGGAVKWLWAKPHTEWFLHIEEGWHLNRPVHPSRLRRDMETSRVVQVRLHNWTLFQRQWRPAKLTTSPSLIRTDFGRMAAATMDADLHPEAQFGDDTNPTLQWAAKKCRAVYHGGIFMPQCASGPRS